jgi:hypothetical protein
VDGFGHTQCLLPLLFTLNLSLVLDDFSTGSSTDFGFTFRHIHVMRPVVSGLDLLCRSRV